MFKAIANSKNVLTFAFLLIAFCCFNSTTYSQSVVTQAGVTRVVVDAGHGGLDPGAVGRISKEKDLNLAVALLLGKMINDHFPDVEVIYTRKDDTFVPLHERSDIANRRNADLFISIHANAAKNKAATGTETFVMGHDKSGANMEVAMRENSVIAFEENYSSKYEGYDPNDPGSFIIFSLQQNTFLHQSQDMATRVQEAFGIHHPIKANRGMKQAGFLVLWRTSMPSILVEMGFISNLEDEKIMASKAGQQAIAKSIFEAFKGYKTYYDRHGELAKNADARGAGNVASANTVERTPAPAPVQAQTQTQTRTPAAQPGTNRSLYSDPTPPPLSYRVQFRAASAKLPSHAAEFTIFENVSYVLHNNIYRYTTGNFPSYEEAIAYCNDVVRKIVKDAFVICVENEKIVPLRK